jgi:heme oxygenase
MSSAEILSVRQFLRSATAVIHQRLDLAAALMRLDTADGYRRFLAGHAAALLPLERELGEAGIVSVLADWPERTRTAALRADLSDLKQGFDPLDPPLLDCGAAILGAAYVLEGSRLGASIIRQSVGAGFPMRYLQHGEGRKFWPSFLAHLEDDQSVRARPEAARAGALAAFSMFETALKRAAAQDLAVAAR